MLLVTRYKAGKPSSKRLLLHGALYSLEGKLFQDTAVLYAYVRSLGREWSKNDYLNREYKMDLHRAINSGKTEATPPTVGSVMHDLFRERTVLYVLSVVDECVLGSKDTIHLYKGDKLTIEGVYVDGMFYIGRIKACNTHVFSFDKVCDSLYSVLSFSEIVEIDTDYFNADPYRRMETSLLDTVLDEDTLSMGDGFVVGPPTRDSLGRTRRNEHKRVMFEWLEVDILTQNGVESIYISKDTELLVANVVEDNKVVGIVIDLEGIPLCDDSVDKATLLSILNKSVVSGGDSV